MNYVALLMLFGDRAKLFGLVFSIAFSSFLLMNQGSIFAGIMARTASQVIDVIDAPIGCRGVGMPRAAKAYGSDSAVQDRLGV